MTLGLNYFGMLLSQTQKSHLNRPGTLDEHRLRIGIIYSDLSELRVPLKVNEV